MSDNGTKPILDLDALLEPSGEFQIAGQRYAFRSWDALGLRERNRITRIDERLRTLETLEGDEAAGAEQEYEDLVREAVSIISDMTEEQARSAQQSKVRDALAIFLGQLRIRQMQLMTQLGNRPTGATSSPGSTPAGRKRERKSG